MKIASLVADHGYLAVFIGTFLEGETVLLMAGFAAHRGLMRLPEVMLLAFVASTSGDQVYYWLGRYYGERLFVRFPALGRQVPTVQRLLEKYHTPLILGIRFLYGLRMAGPLAMGALQVPALRFALLNMVGAAVWAVLVAWLGYQFGNLLELVFHDLRHIEEFVLLVLLIAGVAVAWVRYRRSSRGGT